MRTIEFAGRPNNLLLESNNLRVVVTLDVGPRILHFSTPDGPNVLAVYDRHAGLLGGEDYRSYGGHRLWTSPEVPERTYEADNDPVSVEEIGDTIWFKSNGKSHSGLMKSIGLQFARGGQNLNVHHRIQNQGDQTWNIAPWAVSVMAAGGTCLFPLPSFEPHGTELLPAAQIVLWPYTSMADERWTWGERLVRLCQTEAKSPLKVGALIKQGWAAYQNLGQVFVKQFDFMPAANYPDMGCNFEVFTRHDMLELESLGGLVTLSPGEHIDHSETWSIITDPPPADERELEAFIERYNVSRSA